MKQKISVITVVFNGERYLESTIKSVISQDYPNLEYIIIDGGSTDKTLDIIKKYKENISKIISEPDKGLADAMNKGVSYATGEWILHLHSDDTFLDSMSLQKLMNKNVLNKNFWITGYLFFQDDLGRVFKKDNYYSINWRGMLVRNIIRHQATLVRKVVFENLTFSQNFKYAMDYDFFLRLWDKYGSPFIVKEHIVSFRLDGNNLSSNFYLSLIDEFKVRITFRDYSKTPAIFLFDTLIVCLRFIKIMIYHSIRYKLFVK